MGPETPHVCVCVCTFKRPVMLRRLLDSLRGLRTDGRFSFSVVVVDNDSQESASPVISEVVAAGGLRVRYGVEHRQNIALARNKACAMAEGEFLAWIDDDEFPTADWLIRLLDACQHENVAGVLGPVLPHFDEPPPRWIVKGRFCERPRHRTGYRLRWQEARTGNALVRKQVVDQMGTPFREEFLNGGEDQDFFRRAMERGHAFAWCDEGPVFEVVAPSRWRRGFMVRRALLRGRNSNKHPSGRGANILKSLVAVPAYALLLPVFLISSHHLFMKVLIKLCDHVGRLLAVVNLNPIGKREM